MMSPELAAWRDQGQSMDVLGRRVFVTVRGVPGSPWLVVLHGFPTSSLDFRGVLPQLTQRYRVVLHDHLGFGLSEKPADYSYSILEQAQIAIAVWRMLGIESAHVLAHDYGTSLATELLALRLRALLPIDIGSLTLSNGSVYIELAKLRPIQRLLASPTLGPWVARASGRGIFGKNIRKTLADPYRITERELDLHWEALAHDHGRDRIASIARYVDERRRFASRWNSALARFDKRVHILWGREDPIAVTDIAERLAREIAGSTLTWLDGLGHYPMIEDPKRYATAVLNWLSQ
jgi:pimeloyl-ACP methyl ester carboxylesterase